MAYDSATRATMLLRPLDAFPTDFAGNPNEREVFVATPNEVIGVSASGVRPLPACGGSRPLSAMSADGRRVAASCGSLSTPFVEVRELPTGVLVNQISVAGTVMALNPTGQEFFAIAVVGFSSGELRRFEVATGAVLSARPLVTISDTRLEADPRTGRLILAQGDRPFGGFGNVEVLDPTTLMTIGTLRLGRAGASLPASTTRARAPTSSPRRSRNRPLSDRCTTRDLMSSIPTRLRCSREQRLRPERGDAIVLAPRLGTPVGLAADVSGNRVSLTWNPGPSRATATHYVVEARLSPVVDRWSRLT